MAKNLLWKQAGKLLYDDARWLPGTSWMWAPMSTQAKTSGLGLPDVANKNMRHSVEFEHQIKYNFFMWRVYLHVGNNPAQDRVSC